PDLVKEVYAQHISDIEANTRAQYRKPHNRKEEHDLARTILDRQNKFCADFLNAEKDPVYPEIRANWKELTTDEDPETLPFDNFDDWAANFKEKSVSLAVPIADDWVMN